jgi:hypothetical protein
MKRAALTVLVLGALLLYVNVLTGCQSLPANGSQSRFSTIEVKRFAQVDGLGLSQDFVNYFYDGLREQLQKLRLANQVIEEGAAVPDGDAANSVIIEGKFAEYKQGGFSVGIVGSEIKLYRRNDHTLITTITARVPYKPSPFNTDRTIGHGTGVRTAYEIKKAMQ